MIAEKINQIQDRLAHEPMDAALRTQLTHTVIYLENLSK
jgi:hypothetical protein